MPNHEIPRSVVRGGGRFLVLAFLLIAPAAGRASIEPGTRAPDFTLPTLDGRTSLSLTQTEGYRLLVQIRYGQRFTTETLALCRRLPPRLSALQERCRLILIWVGPLPADSASLTSGTLTSGWRILRDVDERVAQAYQMVVSPTIYLVDAGGAIVRVFTGWHPLLEKRVTDAVTRESGKQAPPESKDSPQRSGQLDRADLYFKLGRVVAAQGFWEEGLGFYERGLTLNPKAVVPLGEAARAAYFVGDRAKAEALARRALDLSTTQSLALAVMQNLEGHPTPLVLESESTSTLKSAGAPPALSPSRKVSP